VKKSKSSNQWLTRQQRDRYVKEAREQGYRSRSVYKLKEIDEKDRLLRPGMTVIDLGAAPGGWSQYASERIGPTGRVLAVDRLPITPVQGVTVIKGDFTENQTLDALHTALDHAMADLVLSDLAPNISGIAVSDQARSVHLAELALALATEVLRSGGALLVKVFQGEGFSDVQRSLLARSRCVNRRHRGPKVAKSICSVRGFMAAERLLC
jgi:23S rRNA (uridine2552-2'-O)-methyltransferase